MGQEFHKQVSSGATKPEYDKGNETKKEEII
jgi:hypothetical protein